MEKREFLSLDVSDVSRCENRVQDPSFVHIFNIVFSVQGHVRGHKSPSLLGRVLAGIWETGTQVPFSDLSGAN